MMQMKELIAEVQQKKEMVESRARDKQAMLGQIERDLSEQAMELEIVMGQVEYMKQQNEERDREEERLQYEQELRE